MIKIDALTVRFGGITPLDALDAEFVAPICGLIGPNGAGRRPSSTCCPGL